MKGGIKKPAALKKGDTIGVVALASPCASERFERGIKYLEGLGFRTKIELDPCADYGTHRNLFASDAPKMRAEALGRLFAAPEVRAIISARGGYGSAEILPLLDFKKMATTPKILSGFSDITAITLAYYGAAKVACVHGPSIESAFSKAADNQAAKQSCELLLRLLSGETTAPFGDQALAPFLNESDAAGPLIGGNLTILSSLMGTPWEPKFDGHILFFEEIEEKPYRLHRDLIQLKISGKLNKLKGVVVGSLRGCVDPKGNGPSAKDAIKDIFKDFGYPVFTDAPFGHEDLNSALPIGIQAQIKNNKLTLSEAVVS